MNKTLKKYIIIALSLLFFFGNYIKIHAENNNSEILNKINSKSKIEIIGERSVQIPVVGETIAKYKLKYENLYLEKLNSKVDFKIIPEVRGVKINKDGVLTIDSDAKSGLINIESNVDDRWSSNIEVQLVESWIYEYEAKESVKVRLANSTDVKEIISDNEGQVINTIIIILRVLVFVTFILIIWYIAICKKRYIEDITDNIKKENEVE